MLDSVNSLYVHLGLFVVLSSSALGSVRIPSCVHAAILMMVSTSSAPVRARAIKDTGRNYGTSRNTLSSA